MTTHTLTEQHGSLYLGEALLLRIYPAGDCDRCAWPLATPEDVERLAATLYDEVQCNEALRDGDAVATPDGVIFGHVRGVHFVSGADERTDAERADAERVEQAEFAAACARLAVPNTHQEFVPAAVTYTLTEGQLVVLHHGRPEDAWKPEDAPTDVLRAFCAWNDRNGEFDELTRDGLLAVVAEWIADEPDPYGEHVCDVDNAAGYCTVCGRA